jgi:hypothetical protein
MPGSAVKRKHFGLLPYALQDDSVKCIERLTFRDLIIRFYDSTFSRNLTRNGWDDLIGTDLLDATWKCISRDTWDCVNKLMLVSAKKVQISIGLTSDSVALFVSVTFITQRILRY